MMKLSETEDKWILQTAGVNITQIQIDYRLGLIISDKERTANIHLETEFRLSKNGNSEVLVPGDISTLSSVASLHKATIREISIFKNGELIIDFDDETELNICPDENYEAWQVSLPGCFLLVCSPGGSVSVFIDNSNKEEITVN